jgi:putative molybdopterin biosynthesis protein
MAIEIVARSLGLGFLPYADEHYDFALVKARRERPAVAAFRAALADPEIGRRLCALGFTPACGAP